MPLEGAPGAAVGAGQYQVIATKDNPILPDTGSGLGQYGLMLLQRGSALNTYEH